MKWLLILCFVLTSLLPGAAIAQLNPSGLGESLKVDLEPELPRPFQEVTARLNDYGINATGASVTWYVNGQPQQAAINSRTLTLTAGGTGQRTVVTVELSMPSGQRLSASREISPSRVDIIFEPDTFTPAFYAGRPLPSVASEVRFIALPFTSSGLSPEQYTYLWRLNGKALEGGELRGRNSIIAKVPFQPDSSISVTVFDPSGAAVARRAVTIPTVEPIVRFYPVSTLNDIAQLAVSNPLTIIGTQAVIRAQPYHLATETVVGQSRTEWKVNGSTVSSGSGDFDISLNGASDQSRVEFFIQNLVDFVQRAQGSFLISS